MTVSIIYSAPLRKTVTMMRLASAMESETTLAIAGIAQIAFFDRLILPYSVHPQTSALRPRTTRLLDRVRENQSFQVFSNEADHPVKYGPQQMNCFVCGYRQTRTLFRRR